MKPLVYPHDVRTPTVKLLLNGYALPGVLGAEVNANSHYQADTWSAELALNANEDAFDFWGGDIKAALIEVRFGLDQFERSMITGRIDKVAVSVQAGTLRLSGRDLSALLIEAKVQETFQNETSSDVVTKIATRRGLTPVVTPTTTLVSRYFGNTNDRVQHDSFSKHGTEWDLLRKLAQDEQFDLYMDGKELHFAPKVDAAKADAYSVRWDQDQRAGNVMNLALERSLTLAKDVVVEVRTWQTATARAFTKTSGTQSKDGSAQVYKFTEPNLTETQAQARADSLRQEITKHERTMRFDMPGEIDLTPRDVLRLDGCGPWDQVYFVDTINRRLRFGGGFTQSVSAKNRSVEADAA